MIHFHCYNSLSGKNEIRLWYESQSLDARAKISAILEMLRLGGPEQWTEPRVKREQGKSRGLYEIRLKLNRTQVRLVGYFEDGKNFVITNQFVKKSRSDNSLGFELGAKRKESIKNGNAKKEKYDFSAVEAVIKPT